MTFKRVISESGLTKVELAELYGVSRQSIHNWINAGRIPVPGAGGTGDYTARMAVVITETLANALDKKLLPLRAMDKEARRAKIAKMARTTQGLKPAPAK